MDQQEKKEIADEKKARIGIICLMFYVILITIVVIESTVVGNAWFDIGVFMIIPPILIVGTVLVFTLPFVGYGWILGSCLGQLGELIVCLINNSGVKEISNPIIPIFIICVIIGIVLEIGVRINKKYSYKVLLISIGVVFVVSSFVFIGIKFQPISYVNISYNELLARFDEDFAIPKGYEDDVVSVQIKYPVNVRTGEGGEYNYFTIKDEYVVQYRLELEIEGMMYSIIVKKDDPNLAVERPKYLPKIVVISSHGKNFICALNVNDDYASYEFSISDVDYIVTADNESEKYHEIIGDLIYDIVKEQ